jgi:hypothetical protein
MRYASKKRVLMLLPIGDASETDFTRHINPQMTTPDPPPKGG